MPEPLVDIVIADYLTPHLAEAAVESLPKMGVPYTVKVIDAYAEKLTYAEAINGGFEGGSAPFVLALNADVECRLSQVPIFDIFERLPEVAVVGPPQVNAIGMIVHGGIMGTNEMPVHRGWGDPESMHPEVFMPVVEDAVTVSGSVYYARRSVWDELGGFLETPHYFEETWFSYLARHRGHRVVFTGHGTWLHLWDSSPLTNEQKGERFAASQAIFRAACAKEGIACD